MKAKMTRAVALITFVWLAVAGLTLAQDAKPAKPRAIFLAIPPHSYGSVAPSAKHLTQWTYSFKYQGLIYTPVIVGTDPRHTNVTTSTPVFIIPIKMIFGKSNGNRTFDPNNDIYPGTKLTVTQYIAQSPIFAPINFTRGGINLGTTQYEDAYERGSLWKYVKTNNKYHVLLSEPTILPEQTIKVAPGQGSVRQNPYGHGKVGFYGADLLDPQLQTYIGKLKQIQPDTLPLFLTYDVYLGCGSDCAVGGYHSAISPQPNGQTYSFAAVIDPDAFAADIGALSHEVGEWMVDPFVDNQCACGGLMEVGDPLETEPNYGYFPYTGSNGLSYHPQDLVFINYFGAPRNTSLKNWFTFQDETNVTAPCDRGSERMP